MFARLNYIVRLRSLNRVERSILYGLVIVVALVRVAYTLGREFDLQKTADAARSEVASDSGGGCVVYALYARNSGTYAMLCGDVDLKAGDLYKVGTTCNTQGVEGRYRDGATLSAFYYRILAAGLSKEQSLAIEAAILTRYRIFHNRLPIGNKICR